MNWRHRRRQAAWALACLLLSPTSLAAEPSARADAKPSYELAWSGPDEKDGCLGVPGLSRAMNEYLGRSAFVAANGERILSISMERLPENDYVAKLQLLDRRSGQLLGERELTSPAPLCASLDEPLSLAVALMIDDELTYAVEPAPPTASTATPQKTPPDREPAPEEEPSPTATETEEPSEPLRVELGAAFATVAGALPEVRPGLALEAELRLPSAWGFLLQGGGFLPATEQLAGRASAEFGLFHAQLSVCRGTQPSPRWHLGLCVGILGLAQTVRTQGFTEDESKVRFALGTTARLRAHTQMSSRVSARLELAALAPAERDRFVYRLDGERQELHRMSAIAGVLSLGASVAF